MLKNHTHVKNVGHTLEFPFGIYWWTLKNLKNHNFEKMKKKKHCWRYHHFTHVYQKQQSYEVQFLDTKFDRIFLSLWAILSFFSSFCPFSPHTPNPENQKFWKNERSIWRCYHFKLAQWKTKSWCMLIRYRVWQT